MKLYVTKIECYERGSPSDKKRVQDDALKRLFAYAFKGFNPKDLAVQRDCFGKPYFINRPDICFNLSHSGGLALLGTGGTPVGVDIEKIREVSSRLAYRISGANDLETLEKMTEDKRLPFFFEIWTAKEAYVKAIGVGLSLSFRKIEIDWENGTIHNGEFPTFYFYHYRDIDGYCACACTQEKESPEIIFIPEMGTRDLNRDIEQRLY